MKQAGFISNRVFDVTASGGFLISDYMPEIKEFYGDSIPMFNSKEELKQLLEHYLAHPEERKEKARQAQEITLRHFTNEAAAKTIMDAVQELRENTEEESTTKAGSVQIGESKTNGTATEAGGISDGENSIADEDGNFGSKNGLDYNKLAIKAHGKRRHATSANTGWNWIWKTACGKADLRCAIIILTGSFIPTTFMTMRATCCICSSNTIRQILKMSARIGLCTFIFRRKFQIRQNLKIPKTFSI